jgi:hypothetical protein
MGLAITPKQRRSAALNRAGDTLPPTGLPPRQVHSDGSLTSPQPSSFPAGAELVDGTTAFVHARHVSRVNEELASGSYKIGSSELADCLMHIADRDAEGP